MKPGWAPLFWIAEGTLAAIVIVVIAWLVLMLRDSRGH